MTLLHERARRRAHLLALDALDAREARAVGRHLAECAACREEHAAARDALAALARDAAFDPPLPLETLAARVFDQLDAEPRGSATRAPAPALGAAWMRPAWAAAAALLAFATVTRVPGPEERMPRVARRAPAAPTENVLLSVDSMQRLERGLARAQTARYLNEAQDVLVTVAARLPRCQRRAPRVEVAAEVRRSRELLARRALMVESGNGHVAAARGVLDDVERVLREVAAFDDCEPSRRVEELSEELDQRRLLMRMALVERELLG